MWGLKEGSGHLLLCEHAEKKEKRHSADILQEALCVHYPETSASLIKIVWFEMELACEC